MSTRSTLVLIVSLLATLACPAPAGHPDTGEPSPEDGGSPFDAGPSSEPHDAGPADAGQPDAGPVDAGPRVPFIGSLAIVTVGSTVDSINGDQNPYGLAIAPVTAGEMTAGDLIICNFNNKKNVQGTGTTIEILHPTPNSVPKRLVQDPNLKGCAALAPDGQDNPWAAAYASNLAPFYTSSGQLVSTLSGGPWDGPWGEIFVQPTDTSISSYFVTSNAGSGTLVNVNIGGTTFLTTVTGFTINQGAVPGTIYAAAGLTYNPANDTLYVVDGNQNRVVQFKGYSTYGANAVTVTDSGFSGPSAGSASVLYAGSALNLPISAALLFNGDLVVGNTGGNTGENVMVEISPEGEVLATQNVDTGPAGAIFGIATEGTNAEDTNLYFNDDNDNTVKLMPGPA